MTRALLLKFSRNQCTEEEIEEIRHWLTDGGWPEIPGETDIPDDVRQQVWDAIHNQVQQKKQIKKPVRLNYKIAKIAAIALVLIGTAVFIFYRNHKTRPPVIYATDGQQHQKIILPDSSVVFLSPASVLTVTQPYGDDQRILKLTGEAVFEVSHNARSPFTVMTRDIATIALGTSFKVSSFNGKDIKIALSYGKIVVEDQREDEENSKVYLKPGEAVVYHTNTHVLQKTKSPADQFDYRRNILYFKNAGIKEVVDKLERYYEIEIDYNALKGADWSVSGEFDYQPLDVVMKTIAYSCNIRFRINGRQLVLLPVNSDQPVR